MPARRSSVHRAATSLVAVTLVVAAFVGVTVIGCSHGAARAQAVSAGAQTQP